MSVTCKVRPVGTVKTTRVPSPLAVRPPLTVTPAPPDPAPGPPTTVEPLPPPGTVLADDPPLPLPPPDDPLPPPEPDFEPLLEVTGVMPLAASCLLTSFWAVDLTWGLNKANHR